MELLHYTGEERWVAAIEITLPKGTVLRGIAHFDNSSANPTAYGHARVEHGSARYSFILAWYCLPFLVRQRPTIVDAS